MQYVHTTSALRNQLGRLCWKWNYFCLSHSHYFSSVPPAPVEGGTPPDWTTTAIILFWPTDAPSVVKLFRTRAGWTYILFTRSWVVVVVRSDFPRKTLSEAHSHSIRPCWRPTCTTSCWSRWWFWYRTRYGRDSGSHWNIARSRRTCRPSRKPFGANFSFRAALRWNTLEVPIYL